MNIWASVCVCVCVCSVTVHSHVYRTNSQQVKKTLLLIQVMTHLLSTWSLFALTMLLMRVNSQHFLQLLTLASQKLLSVVLFKFSDSHSRSRTCLTVSGSVEAKYKDSHYILSGNVNLSWDQSVQVTPAFDFASSRSHVHVSPVLVHIPLIWSVSENEVIQQPPTRRKYSQSALVLTQNLILIKWLMSHGINANDFLKQTSINH